MAEEQADSTTFSKPALPATYLLFQEPDPSTAIRRSAPAPVERSDEDEDDRKPRRRGSRGRGRTNDTTDHEDQDSTQDEPTSSNHSADESADVSKGETRTRTRSRNRSRQGSSGSNGDDRQSGRRGKDSRDAKDSESDSSDSADSSDKESSDSPSDSSRSSRASTRASSRSSSTRSSQSSQEDSSDEETHEDGEGVTTRRRRRRRSTSSEEVTALKGSTRLEAKRQRRKDGREAGRRRTTITESEFLARRESVNRKMLVREQDGLNQIAVLEDDILVEHYVARHTQVSMVGNVYLGRVQNVLPSMEAAFVDIGKGRNAVLYAGEVNWEAAGLEGKPRRIESALKSGETVLVQVTKDPIGHKGARLTAQITLAGRHLVLVPSGAMTGISRKLPERERQRLKKLLKELVPDEHGVIVRTAAEGATEDQLRKDIERLTKKWAEIQEKSKSAKSVPVLLKGEPELAVRVVRDVFNEDFESLHVQGDNTYATIKEYVHELSPELDERVHKWVDRKDIFTDARVDEQLAKAMDRKVYLPSGGSLVIDRTEAMTVVDVNTGRFTGSGGTLEETVTKNNLEAAEEIVRQLRLRDIGGIIVIDFIDMVLESNRDLVLRRLIECLGRDRTRHQVAEVTSLGLVQMTRKRVGQGLVEAFSTTCEACEGRGYHIHTQPVEKGESQKQAPAPQKQQPKPQTPAPEREDDTAKREEVKSALASIAAAAAQSHQEHQQDEVKEEAPKEHARKSKSKRSDKHEHREKKDSHLIPDLSEDLSKLAADATSKPKGAEPKVSGKIKFGDDTAIIPAHVEASDPEQGTASNGSSAQSAKPPAAPKRQAVETSAAPAAERKSRRVASSGTITTSSASPIIVTETPAPAPAKATPKPARKKAEKVEEKPEDESRKTRRVASSGTIIPKSSSTPAIMTFPVQ
ncbi:MAG: Rne/Rng family ribonuclease [Flaviflexus sp.]|uniref:Rne/Rng family ribonuclease n=1 Tax=Flaviflexus sp. TaxID=1969482 RepID=UPI00352EE602